MRLRQIPKNFNKIYEPVIIKPAPANEATIIGLASGALKIFYINRPGSANKMMSVSSNDMGKTWTEPQKEFDLQGEAYYANQVLQDKNGTIHCIYHLYSTGNKGYRGRHLNLWYTRQETGKNWEMPRQIWEGYVGSIRGFIQLKNGRLLIPMSEANASMANKPTAGETDYGLFSVISLYSDDLGATWHQSDNSLKTPIESSQVTRYGAVEPNAIELKNGTIWMLIRTNKGHLYQSFSKNGGKTWEEATKSPFISSDSPASTLRLSNGKILILWSSNQRYDDKRSYANGGREVLHAAISDDETKTWKGFREVLISPSNTSIKGDRGTAYPSVVETKNGKILGVSGQGEERSIFSFDPKWLLEKKLKDDFSKGLIQWTLFGADSLMQLKNNNLYLSGNKEAVWNFPMVEKGEITLTTLPYSKNQEIAIDLALNDHFSISSDSAASKNAGTLFSIADNSPKIIKIQWNTNTKKAYIALNGKRIAEKQLQKEFSHGFNYLRISCSNTTSQNQGYFLESIEFRRK